jgi:hypothetical protein
MLSDVLLGDYAVFSASFNFLLYFLSAARLSNSRIFFKELMQSIFILDLYLMLRKKILRPIVELSLSF